VVEGEAVLLDLHGRRIMGLNAVGSFVFGLIDGVRTVEALSAAVVERFHVDAARARADVSAFLVDLRTRRLVEGGEA
jgi:Coenzyme PQQ synthesis protein D (PqqD)